MVKNMKKMIRRCPICNNEYGEVYKTIKMKLPQDVKLPDEYDVVTCENCGFAYADVDATQDTYNTYYACNNMYSADAALKEKIVDIIADERELFFENNISKNAKILDMGCGSGALLTKLKRKGFDKLFGIDPSQESIEVVQKHEINVQRGNVFDEIPRELVHSFDIVCFTAVLEHVYELNRCIEQLQGYLTKGGLIYLSVPSVEEFGKKYRPLAHYCNHEHINYFSSVSLDNLMRQHGFDVYLQQPKEYDGEDSKNEHEMDISCLYRYVGKEVKSEIKKDYIGRKSILNYLELEKENETKIYNKILDFIMRRQQKIIIWGTGAYTLQIIANIPQLSERILFFVDSNPLKIWKKIVGKEIVASSNIMKIGREYPIIICAIRGAKDIEKMLHEMNIENEYIVL